MQDFCQGIIVDKIIQLSYSSSVARCMIDWGCSVIRTSMVWCKNDSDVFGLPIISDVQ